MSTGSGPSAGNEPSDHLNPSDQLADVRQLLAQHTQQLLGDTISLTDEQWRAPSRLPEWSRGHVATHLARQADALRRLSTGALSGEPGTMYGSEHQRDDDIAAGAGRNGMDLQVDLDTSAGALATDFEALAAEDRWGTEVELRGGQKMPARLLPLTRLGEVVLHHVDLDVGVGVDDIDDVTAGWLLEYLGFRLGTGFPRVRLEPDGGAAMELGDQGDVVTVAGPANRLLGWLTSRGSTEGLTGADGIELPAFG